MKHAELMLYIPFSAPDEAWVVRRAHTVVKSYATCDKAVMGAFEIAAALSRCMGVAVCIKVQAADGQWRSLSPVATYSNA